ncbi:hypothetical protein V8C86DRAFT_2557091 [Haematococcus lacustris]
MDVDGSEAQGPGLEADAAPTAVEAEFASPAAWRRALDAVVPCCVVLKVTLTRPVDTEPASSSYATGFIVDKARGILLTNRHVHTPGPIVAEAIFLNREELPVYPLYFDPVHDFALLRFDPAKLTFMTVSEVPLAPEAASVGLDIRVVGNDSGEKVSILPGVIARLDRDAPVYGKGYNDFNTFYLQAASGTKGGSSGSPVIDIQGRAVGLNAGGKNKAASAYYLPLERVQRALRIIQASKEVGSPADQWPAPQVPRGDLQVTFSFRGFDEVRRLGLRQETERCVRAAPARTHGHAGDGELSSTGLLVVDSVVPGSPADGVLEVGDVLVRVNGQVVTHFLPLEEILDDAVGQPVALSLERGGLPVEVSVVVTDLHSVTPASFLELCGGTVHALSYQAARNQRTRPGQVYVAEPGYMLGRSALPKHAIITALAGQPTPDLLSFARVLRGLPHGARTPLEYFTHKDRNRRLHAILHMDRQWYGPPVYWQRDDATGTWRSTTDYPPGVPDPQPAPAAPPSPLTTSCPPLTPAPQEGAVAAVTPHSTGPGPQPGVGAGAAAQPAEATQEVETPAEPAPPASPSPAGSSRSVHVNGVCGLSTTSSPEPEQPPGSEYQDRKLEERLRCSLVLVDVDIPLVALTDGVHARSFAGNGLVVHHGARLGLVLVDRNTVAVGPCDCNLSFGAHPAEISATVCFLHPLYNFALVSYDPRALPAEARAKVLAAELLPHPHLHRGDTVVLAGLTKFLRIMQRKSVVTTATSAITIPAADVPRFRAVHEEVVKLDQDFGATFSGVLTDAEGRVRALWGSYAEQVDKEEREWCAGLPTACFQPWMQRLLVLEEQPDLPPPRVWTLDAELEPLLLSKAAQFGLPASWVSRLDRRDPERRQVLRVRGTVADSHAASQLRCGDMVLAIAGTPVTCFRDVEAIILAQEQPEATAACPVPHYVAAEGAVGLCEQAPPGQHLGKKRKAEEVLEKPSQENEAQQGQQAPTCKSSAMAGGQATQELVGVDAQIQDSAHTGSVARPHTTAPVTEQAASPLTPLPSLPITIFRGTELMQVTVQLGSEAGMGTSRVLHWCGAQLQSSHRAVRELGSLPQGVGVYISRWHHGSPAHRYGLYALHWITEANGQPTPDLDTFLEVVRGLGHGEFVRIKMHHLETCQPKVLTLKLDLNYWPTWELRLDQTTRTWSRISISPAPNPS